MEHVSSVRPTGKFPEKVENLKRWSRFPGWNFQTECRVPFTFLVVCTSSRTTVGHRQVPVFTTKWNNFLPIGNSSFATKFPGFFLNGKRPLPLVWAINRVNITRKKSVLGEASTSFPASRDGLVHNIIRASSTAQEHQENACTVS